MIKKARNQYIDVMKGLLITLVVIGHLPFFDYNSRTLILIYSFHMPAFLIIAGMLSHIDEKTDFFEILFKRFKNILVPYFIFYLISLILVPVPSWDERTQAVIVMFKGIGDPNHAVNLPLWFLTFYFCAITIFELLECIFYKFKKLLFGKKTKTKNEKLAFVELFVFIAIAIIMYIAYYYARIIKGVRLPFNLEISAFCLAFVFLGKMIGVLFTNAISFIKKNTALTVFSILISIIIIVIFIIYWYILSMKNGRIDLNARDYKNAFLMYVDAILGFCLFSLFALFIYCLPIIRNFFAYCGENSIYILAYHVPSTIITYNIIIPLLPVEIGSMLSVNSIPSILILTACGILFSLFMGLIHKTCHFPA